MEKTKYPDKNDRPRRNYVSPKIESETIFETKALACGKCRSGSHRQHACMRLAAAS